MSEATNIRPPNAITQTRDGVSGLAEGPHDRKDKRDALRPRRRWATLIFVAVSRGTHDLLSHRRQNVIRPLCIRRHKGNELGGVCTVGKNLPRLEAIEPPVETDFADRQSSGDARMSAQVA